MKTREFDFRGGGDVKGREREKGGVRGGAGGDEGDGDGASTNVPIAPRDAYDGRVSGLVS